MASPAEVPHAAQSDGEPQNRRKRGQPPPMGRTGCLDLKTKPLRQKPEPEREERCAYRECGGGGWPVLLMQDARNVFRM
jgi:hypothetical protein